MFQLNLLIILFIGFVDYLGIGLVYPVFAVLLFDPNDPVLPSDSSLAYRGAMLGLLIAMTPLSQFVSSPVLGVFSDRKGRRIALITGICAGCVGYALAVLGIHNHSFLLLFLYRILVGISDGTAAVAQAALSDISNEQNKAKRFAWLNSSLGFGFTVGPFIGGKISDPSLGSWFGYTTPFVVAGILCVINLLLVIWKFPETHFPKDRPSFNLRESLANFHKAFFWKHLRWLFIAGFALSFGWTTFNEFIPVFLKMNFGFTLSDIGNFYAYSGAWYAISAGFLIIPLLNYFKVERLVTVSLWGCSVVMLSFLLVTHSFYIWFLVPFMMLFLATAFPTATTLVSNRTVKESQGEVLGVFQSIQASAMGLCPLIIGWAIGIYPGLTAWGGALAMLFGSFAFWIGCRISNKKSLG